MYTVFVRGLEFYAHHGVPDEEQVIGHRYSVDIDLEVDGKADESDSVDDTADYGAVSALVQSVGRREQVRTVERLAAILGDAILARFPLTQTVTVNLMKRLPPTDAIIESAGVRLHRTRS
ncbi:MAG: dihydroneopterin aldolase [Fimbriimonadaceae bacterium]|nr:dihydroneopterin aldolase [Fimbriimonadaceae bacterium]